MSKIVFDIETDGLLYESTKIHCISTYDIELGLQDHFGPDEIGSGVDRLMNCDLLIGHNISGFDLPMIEKWANEPLWLMQDLPKVRDTYVMSKLFYPNRLSHSLDAWARKFNMVKPEHEDWSVYSEEMRYRNEEDVRINTKLYSYMIDKECKRWSWLRAIQLEQEMHYWQAAQELHGVAIDKRRGLELVEELDTLITEIDEELRPQLPKIIKKIGGPIREPFKINGDYKQIVKDHWNETT